MRNYTAGLEACNSLIHLTSVSADLQMVNITLRVLSKPDVESLSTIYKVGASSCRIAALLAVWTCLSLYCFSQNLGLDWDERVLPSIGNEIVKAAVAQYNAEQLLTQRDRVSRAVSCPRHIEVPSVALVPQSGVHICVADA